MIEVIYKEEKQEAQGNEGLFYIPRNIRQIGFVHENYKIYIEDYVYTFLVRLSRPDDKKDGEKAKIAVLTGETKWWSGTSYLFIKGALMTEGMEAAEDHIDFTEEVWGKIHEEQAQYFGEQEIVGWFFSRPQLSMEMTELFSRVHLRHFGGEKVLMLMEPLEREDAFFRYENSSMAKQSGYYIYYEKNSEMQAYMIDKNAELQPELTETYADDAVKSFRKIITNKKKEDKKDRGDEHAEDEQPSVFSYAATACLAVAVLVVGVNFYRNYQNMQSIEKEVQQTSSIIVEEVTPVPERAETAKTSKEKGLSAEKTAGESADKEQRKQETEAVQKTSSVQEKQTGETKQETASVQEKQAEDKNAADGNETADSKPQKEPGTEASSSSVYREEADIRKAKRREAQVLKEQEETEAASDHVKETYVIKPGDTIFQISMDRYGSMDAMEEICRLNGLSLEEIIYPGQVIVLP